MRLELRRVPGLWVRMRVRRQLLMVLLFGTVVLIRVPHLLSRPELPAMRQPTSGLGCHFASRAIPAVLLLWPTLQLLAISMHRRLRIKLHRKLVTLLVILLLRRRRRLLLVKDLPAFVVVAFLHWPLRARP